MLCVAVNNIRLLRENIRPNINNTETTLLILRLDNPRYETIAVSNVAEHIIYFNFNVTRHMTLLSPDV